MMHNMMQYTARTLSFSRRLLLIVAGSMAVAWPVLIVAQTPAPPAAAAGPANEVHARGDMAGNWQGTVEMGKSIRTVLQISKTDKGWSGKMFLFGDDGARPFDAASISLDGSTFKYQVPVIGGSYQGTLSADGNSIVGTLTGGPSPTPLTFVRATKETAWEIPAPPPPPKLMAADADPSFDVVTIKPNDSGATSIQGLNVRGRNFTTRASSVDDLIKFAYGVHVRQIVGGPEWLDKDRYDINGVPDKDGTPNATQLQTMMKKLLADRFKLTFHHEKRDLSAFVLEVGKDGQKLAPTQLNGPLPGLGFRPVPGGITLNVVNGTMGDFTDFLQMLVLDRPVVDRTGITGRYDFRFTFTPDDSLFNGHPPRMPAQADGSTAEAAPGFFEAIQKDIGLKLDAQKTAVDVIVIDHVEKPSAN
jgi:uncharacterized protein (TIGR03435 family)